MISVVNRTEMHTESPICEVNVRLWGRNYCVITPPRRKCPRKSESYDHEHIESGHKGW